MNSLKGYRRCDGLCNCDGFRDFLALLPLSDHRLLGGRTRITAFS